MNENLSTRIALYIVSRRVSVPTWVVLYINILISVIVANSVYMQDSLIFTNLAPFGGKLWSLMLLGASLITLHGLLRGYHRTVAIGSMLGFMSWALGLISWIVISKGSAPWGVPLLTLPMLAFFTFVHLKHSIIERWRNEQE